MKNFTLRKIFTTTASAAIAGLSITSAMGQAPKLLAEKPTFDELQSPEHAGGGRQKPFKPKNWLEMEAKLNIAGAAAAKTKVCDRLTLKWYVAVKNPDKAGSMLLLTKDVEHVNIPYDEDVYVSVYLSPVSVKRLTGSDRAGKSAVEAVGYEVLVNGVKVASENVGKGKAGWWLEASDKISKNETVPLLNKAETPFRAMWWDRYAEVNEGRGLR
jgi:hypothetical protein